MAWLDVQLKFMNVQLNQFCQKNAMKWAYFFIELLILEIIYYSNWNANRCTTFTLNKWLPWRAWQQQEKYLRKQLKSCLMTKSSKISETFIKFCGMFIFWMINREICIRYADMERKLGEIDRARAIYVHCSQICDPKVK